MPALANPRFQFTTRQLDDKKSIIGLAKISLGKGGKEPASTRPAVITLAVWCSIRLEYRA